MTQSYKEYLASRVLADGHPVTYRLLSRAVNVNVDVAKHMLYEFHKSENAKKPNSVHATYLLTGLKRRTRHANGTNGTNGTGETRDLDTLMFSSPPRESIPEPEDEEEREEDRIPQTSVVIVREEELDTTKKEFEAITSVHIYSLEAGPIENLNLLIVCNQEIEKDFVDASPLDRWKTYGSIHNPFIKRRTAKFAPKPAPGAAKPVAKPTVKTEAKPAAKPAARPSAAAIFGSKTSALSEPKGGETKDKVSGQSVSTSSLKKSGSKPNLKKEKSDIFASFAKAKPKAKESTPAPTEDDHMQGMSEDEGDDEEEIKIDQEKQAAARKARTEREEKLRKMMDDEEDDEMLDAPPEEKASQNTEVNDVAMGEPTATEPTITVEGGRRRGRRRVMKKKVQKDADGYLVTKEEAVWESFSEEEVVPKKPKPAPKPTNTAKGKKAAKGQGNIASFFKKA